MISFVAFAFLVGRGGVVFHIWEVKGLSDMFIWSRGFLVVLGNCLTYNTSVIADGPRSAIAQLSEPAQESLIAFLLIVELSFFDLFT